MKTAIKKKQAAKSPSLACPTCGGHMVLRNGKFGEFYGCQQFPACRGTKPVEEAATTAATWKQPVREKLERKGKAAEASPSPTEPIGLVPGSPEQEAIWEAMQPAHTTHMVVKAYAGTGKTFSMVQGVQRLPKTLKIAFIAFNKHIATEAQEKLLAAGCTNVLCCTYHSLGYRILRTQFPNAQISDTKTDDIMESFPVPGDLETSDWRSIMTLTGKLVGLAKNYLLRSEDINLQEQLEELADHHSIDLNGIGRQALNYVAQVLEESKRRASYSIDFDDMIWLPAALNLRITDTFDYLIVDEAQDTNKAQQELALRACPTGRIIIVGDPYQAIYGFRGADVYAMPSMKARLEATQRGVEEFPLTVTRRCPKSHVQLAQGLVPDIQAMEDAPDGVVEQLENSQAVAQMRPGDMVLCRTNKDLIPTAYALIERGIKPVIRGRDIGKGLLELVARLQRRAHNLPELLSTLNEYLYREQERLAPLGSKAAGRATALQDRCDCLQELIRQSSSIADLISKIETLFSDFDAGATPQNAVVLGTVHRTKGLEATRIFIVSPELIPHPMARQPWEHIQEKNLAYVAVTRSKYTKDQPGTLIFCGAIPSVYHPEKVKGEVHEEKVNA